MEEKIQRRSSVRPFIYGLAAGAATGALLGILLTPRNGKEMRHNLAQFAGKVRGRASRHNSEGHPGALEDTSVVAPSR